MNSESAIDTLNISSFIKNIHTGGNTDQFEINKIDDLLKNKYFLLFIFISIIVLYRCK